MKKLLSVIGTAVVLALVQSNAFGWADAGHMAIAAEAYHELTPQQKAQVFEVLKAHPDFAKWSKSYHPNPAYDLSEYVFIRSSTWPDQIRRSGTQYDHPNWHFIDYPLRPPSFPMEQDDKTNDNVVYAIAQCEKTLSDTNAPAEARAAYLSYLVHCVGDLHQPLHCASFYGGPYTNGDRGGNDFYVKPAQQGIKLHAMWDTLLGGSANPFQAHKAAATLLAQFSRASLPELNKDASVVSWSLESRNDAIEKGYVHGTLKIATNAADAGPLPPDYMKEAKATAQRRGALAGYRLTDEIQKYLKLGKDVPLLPPNTVKAATNLPKIINTEAATNFYDEEMTVTGKVMQVNILPKITFINLDKSGPQSPFTCVIFPDNMGTFPNIQSYTNHQVTIHGTITEYKDKPEVVLETADQIKITDGK